MAHAGDLRDHWGGELADWRSQVRTVHALGEQTDALAPTAAVAHFVDGLGEPRWLSSLELVVLRFVAKLTLHVRGMRREDLAPLVAAGLDDAGMLDVVQVCACFSYMNRLADGTGVLIEERHRRTATQLFDEATIERHLEWGAP